MASLSSKRFQETRHPLYRGVRKRGASDRWVSEVREPKKKTRLWLGTFPTADMAARAHDVAVLALRGRSACLNFADSAWLLHLPASFSSVKDIKRAAIEAAELFRPRKEEEQDLEDACSSTSADMGSTEEKEVTSSSSLSSNSSSNSSNEGDEYDAMMFDLGRNGEMDLGSYYASLAEGLLMEPPVRRYDNWDDDEGYQIEVPLWS